MIKTLPNPATDLLNKACSCFCKNADPVLLANEERGIAHYLTNLHDIIELEFLYIVATQLMPIQY